MSTTSDGHALPSPHWYFNPYLHVVICILCITASEILMKIGADQTAAIASPVPGVTGLLSPFVWGGIVFYIINFLSWLIVLKRLPLNIAFNLVNLNYVTVILASAWLLGENISWQRALGVAFVVTGVFVIAKARVNVEDRI